MGSVKLFEYFYFFEKRGDMFLKWSGRRIIQASLRNGYLGFYDYYRKKYTVSLFATHEAGVSLG